MPVRKASAGELLGGKPLVMSANPGIARGFKKLREMQIQAQSQTGQAAPPEKDKPAG